MLEDRMRREWRFLSVADRPLPPPGRADSGLVAFGTWSDGLAGEAKKRTLELLKTRRWQRDKQHSSVHLTMYLRWAEEQLQSQAATRMAAMDIGRHISGFL